MKAVLFIDGKEVKRAPYPNRDMSAIKDLEKGFEWRLVRDSAIPEFDPTTHRLTFTESNKGRSDTEFPHLKSIDVVYRAELLPVAVSDRNFDKLKSAMNAELLSRGELTELVITALCAINKKTDNQNLNETEQFALEKIEALFGSLEQNEKKVKKLKDDTRK